ncbi:MAG: ribosomal biogenesis protein [Thermoplasmata archaeon]|nr:MAG: ribosomal biogenesis protein [Thermoplasmata archaeon]
MILLTTWFGVFVLDDGRIVEKVLFPKDAREIAERIGAMRRGEALREEVALIQKHSGIKVCDERLSQYAEVVEPPALEIHPEDFGYTTELLRDAYIVLGEEELGVKKDEDIISMIRAVDDLIRMDNTLSERIREWLSWHLEIAKDEDALEVGKRAEIEEVKPLVRALESIRDAREEVEKSIEEAMKKRAPNVTKIVGPIIGARLISQAGGIERLAMMPASTIQVLGAEKSLFRHIRRGSPPPKHGVIFQHHLVHGAPRALRGKIARMLASKLAIAARADAAGKYIADDLVKKLEKRLEEIKRHHGKK